MDLTFVIGTIAAISSTMSFAPQAIRITRTIITRYPATGDVAVHSFEAKEAVADKPTPE